MKRSLLLRGAIVGGLTGIGLVGLFSLGNLVVGTPFVPFDLFDWLTRILPGAFITFAIDTMVKVITGLKLGPTASTAKFAEQSIAILEFVLLGVVFGLVVAVVAGRRPGRAAVVAMAGAALVALVTFIAEAMLGFSFLGSLISVIWIAVLLLAWGWLLSTWAALETTPLIVTGSVGGGTSRRAFLFWVGGGSIALALAALGLSRPRSSNPVPVTSGQSAGSLSATQVAQTSGPAGSPPQSELAKRILPAPETRAELTPTDQFYRIDINADIPSTDSGTWRLQLDGLVDHPLSLSIEDLRKLPPVAQVITLECISNEVGGDLISTGEWKGVPFKTVLAQAGLKPEAAFFNITSFDGFYESLGMNEAMDERTLLVYDMNGAPLPPEHGFPLRIYIPNHYGMKQPKWIQHIEVSDKIGRGYWIDRGWSATAIVQTTAVIDTVAGDHIDPQKQTVPVGGIAYAGARGISKVEVQVDNGPWVQAQLRVPPLSPLTWVQWRYDYPYQKGHHDFRVRAYDGTGKLQETSQEPTYPDGATGVFSFSADL